MKHCEHFPVFYFLHQRGSCSVSYLAEILYDSLCLFEKGMLFLLAKFMTSFEDWNIVGWKVGQL
jgi:hypothetical protein